MSTVDIDKRIDEALHPERNGLLIKRRVAEGANYEHIVKESLKALLAASVADNTAHLKAELLAKNTDFIQWLYMRDFGETLTTERLERAYKEYAANN